MAAGEAFAVDHCQISQTGDAMFSGYLEPVLAKDYFAEAEKTSIVQRFAQKIPMGSTGVKIPHWTGDVSAQWIGEGDMKPITKGDLTSQTISPAKIATIFVASAETVRANPAGYLTTMRTKVATAIALAFDEAVLRGTDTPFGAFVNQTTKTQALGTDAYNAIAVTGLGKLVTAGQEVDRHLLDDVTEPTINGSVDAQGVHCSTSRRTTSLTSPFREGRIVGRPTVVSDHAGAATVLGYIGDFSNILWGQIGGISFDVTDQATLNLGTFAAPNFVSLWQHNLVAVRVEAEYAALVNDPEDFVKLTA